MFPPLLPGPAAVREGVGGVQREASLSLSFSRVRIAVYSASSFPIVSLYSSICPESTATVAGLEHCTRTPQDRRAVKQQASQDLGPHRP